MPFYTYKAREVSGKSVSGLVEAPSSQGATKLLHDKQLFVISVTESKRNSSGAGKAEHFLNVSLLMILLISRDSWQR